MVFSEESLRDIEKRTRSHDIRSLRCLTGLKKSKHALHDATIRDSPQWGKIKKLFRLKKLEQKPREEDHET